MKRFLWLGAVAFLFVICTACGDTFRPVIIPNPPAFPDPRASHSSMTVNDNGVDRGTNMVINVSGDTDTGVADMDTAPIHAVQQTASQVLVVNQGAPGTQAPSLTRINFLGTTIAATSTFSLPTDSTPNFIATTESGQAYVSLPGLIPPSIGVVNTANGVLLATVAVGTNPVAIAETPDTKKVYVANQASNSVTAVNTIDHSVRPFDANGFALVSPQWIVARSDNQRVYVLNNNGSLATLDITSSAGTTDQITSVLANVGVFSLPLGARMLYDGNLNRIYVPSASQVAVIDVAQDPPKFLGHFGTPLPIDTFPRENRDPLDVCFGPPTNTPPAVSAVAVAALPDGSRFYVGSFYLDGANICPQVTVFDSSSNTPKTTAAVPGTSATAPLSPPICSSTRFRFNMAPGGDSSRVYMSNCDAGGVDIIDTSTDTYIGNLVAPASARAPIPPDKQPPPQNPVFLIAGP